MNQAIEKIKTIMKPNGKPSGKQPCFQLSRAFSATLDLLIFLLAATALIFIEFSFENVQRGFFCGDKSLAFTRKSDTISIKTVIVFGLSPIILLLIFEYVFVGEVEVTEKRFKQRLILSWRRSLGWLKDYGINLVLMLLVMDVSKVFIGEHRPHFFDTCRPDSAKNCSIGEFISNFECTNKEASSYSLRDSSRSFPSGHACISVYTSLFLVWHLQTRIPKLQSIFFIPFLQSLLMIWTSVVCSSRITDHRHHWYDVLGGVVLGSVFAIYTCHVLCYNFRDENDKLVACNGPKSHNTRKSVRRLLSTISAKEEFTLNNLE